MSLGSFYKDDILGCVTSSNNIPWLYDLDTCCADDVMTAPSLTGKEDVGDSSCKVRAGDLMFSDTSTIPLDTPASEAVGLSHDSVHSGKMSREDIFIKSFSESLSSSIIHSSVNAADIKSSVPGGAAVSRLTKLYVRNVIILGVAMMLAQAPFYGVRSFQSSLNGWSGRCALIIYHVMFIVAIPIVGFTAVSARIRPKTALILSLVAGLPFAIMAASRITSLETSVLLPVTAAASGSATMWMSEMQDTYVTSLGALCAALSDDQRAGGGGRDAARHFIKLFSQYLLVMQQVSVLVGNFATSSVYLMTQNLTTALFTSPGK